MERRSESDKGSGSEPAGSSVLSHVMFEREDVESTPSPVRQSVI